ncbi:MAG: hypothetical protein NW208_06410 [Bryobacter sp.]|nr:hypothetical protein [Bryobacter sp.]
MIVEQKRVLVIGFLLLVCGSYGQTNRSSERDQQKKEVPEATALVIQDYLHNPTTLKELYQLAEVVVDGIVEAKLPSYWTKDQTGILTDNVVATSEFFKGDSGLKQFLLVETGGTIGRLRHELHNAVPVQKGERYIFFLVADNRLDLPPVKRLVRYSTVIGKGNLRVTGNVIMFPRETAKAMREAYEGIGLEEFKIELRKLAGR